MEEIHVRNTLARIPKIQGHRDGIVLEIVAKRSVNQNQMKA